MNKLELCQKLIEEAMRCLENNDRECVMRMIEELIKNQCHDGRLIGKEVADGVRDIVHELWLRSDNRCRCELLSMLRDLGISKSWVRLALNMNAKDWNKWLVKCGIDWEGKATRDDVVRQLEDLLRKMGWSESKMCESLFYYVGIDVDEFRKYSVEPCAWLEGLESLRDLRRPYWFGLARSDLSVKKYDRKIRLILNTTNAIDAIFFLKILSMIKTPSLVVKWKRGAPGAKYVRKSIELSYYVDLGIDKWPWPIKPDVDELEKIIESFTDEELAEFIAGLLDGDGMVILGKSISIKVATCKNCPKRYILDVLKKIIAKRFGVIGHIEPPEDNGLIDRLNDVYLSFYDKNAVRLLRRVAKYVHHPLRRLRIELLLAYYDGKISKNELIKLYGQTEYKRGRDDIKRNRGLEALARAAPQTHTHGEHRFMLNRPMQS